MLLIDRTFHLSIWHNLYLGGHLWWHVYKYFSSMSQTNQISLFDIILASSVFSLAHIAQSQQEGLVISQVACSPALPSPAHHQLVFNLSLHGTKWRGPVMHMLLFYITDAKCGMWNLNTWHMKMLCRSWNVINVRGRTSYESWSGSFMHRSHRRQLWQPTTTWHLMTASAFFLFSLMSSGLKNIFFTSTALQAQGVLSLGSGPPCKSFLAISVWSFSPKCLLTFFYCSLESGTLRMIQNDLEWFSSVLERFRMIQSC